MSRFSTPVERRWHGLDDGVLAYALAALRSLWIWPVLYLATWGLFPGQSDLLAPLTVFGLLAGGTLAAQCGSFLLEGRRAALAVALAGLVAVLIALYLGLGRELAPLWDPRWLAALPAQPGRALLILLPAVGLWWWGLLAGRDRVSYDSLVYNFTLGLTGLMLVVVLSSATQIMPTSTTLAILLTFLALGLFVLALASIQAARRYESARAGHDLPLARHWWGTVGAIVAALLLVALLLSRFFLPETLGSLAAGITTVLTFLGRIFVWLIVIVSYPIFMLLEWLVRLLPVREGMSHQRRIALPPSFSEQFGNLTEGSTALAPGLEAPLWIIGGVVVAGLVMLIFLLAFRRFRTYAEEDVAEAHESILSLDLLKAQLARLLRRHGAGNGALPAPFVALSGNEPHVRVRRTYQALLAWAAAHELARPPGITPERYQQLLSDGYPSHGEQFRVITAAYGFARYGAMPVSEESAVAAAAAWQQIIEYTEMEVPDMTASIGGMHPLLVRVCTFAGVVLQYSSLDRGVAQPGSALEWGSRSRRFKSSRPDQTVARLLPNTRWGLCFSKAHSLPCCMDQR